MLSPSENDILCSIILTVYLGPEKNSTGKKEIHKKLHLKVCARLGLTYCNTSTGGSEAWDWEFKVIFCLYGQPG